MRVLVYGMQSSGASTLTYLLAQIPEAYTVGDQYCMHQLPIAGSLPTDALIVAKTTVSSDCPLEQHCESFRPDRRVLVIRHPYHNYVSLVRKPYAGLCGSLEEKFRTIEKAFLGRHEFDVVLRFEDLLFRRGEILRALTDVDIPLTTEAFALPRSMEEVVRRTCSIPALEQSYRKTWGRGNVRGATLRPGLAFKWVAPGLRREIATLCPSLLADYRAYVAGSFGSFRVEASGVLNDLLLWRAIRFSHRARRRLRRSRA